VYDDSLLRHYSHHDSSRKLDANERRGRKVLSPRDLRVRAVLAGSEAQDMRHGSGWIYRCVFSFFLWYWDAISSSLSATTSSFGFFFSSEGLARRRRAFLAFLKLARLEKERGRKTVKAPSLAVVVVVVFSLDRVLEDDDDHPYKNAADD
jgi:hypothetical protein